MAEPQRLPRLAEALVLAAQASSPTVRLVGGAGLSLLLGHRSSDDLDLFCALHEDVEPIVRAVEAGARAQGAEPARVRVAPSFVRLELASPPTLRVDVASDSSARLVEEDTYVGPIRVESLRDQRANKIVTLLGRSELRDLIDLYFIEQAGLPAIEGFEDAVKKDAGMDPAWFAWALGQIAIRPLRGLLAAVSDAEIEGFRDRLQREALQRAGA
jgi:hypothetical protein